MVLSPAAHAACSWTPALTLSAHSTHASGAFSVTFGTVNQSTCGTFTLHHYQIVLNDSATPTSPTDGLMFGANASPKSTFVHRADRLYYAKVYACDDAACTDVLGDGAGETITGTSTGSGTTEAEVWVLTSVADQSDTSHYVVSSDSATSPSSFFYPPGWTREGQLALYYSEGDDEIYMPYTDADGWQDFNDTAWTDNGVVAESQGGGTDFDGTSHPSVLPVVTGSGNRVRMLAQNSGSSKKHLVTVDSTDDTGDDFNLTCGTCCAGGTAGECYWSSVASVAICADSTSGCSHLARALHSRWQWDLIAYGPPVLASEYPTLLFTGSEDGNAGCDVEGGSTDDVYGATWSGSAWAVDMTSSCPTDPFAVDEHDPAVTAYPGDEFKVYVVDSSSPYDVVTYYQRSNGTWEAQTPVPTFELEDSTVITGDCLADLDSFVFNDSGTPREGMFLKVAEDGDTNFEGHLCNSGTAAAGIYFAELSN